MQPGINLVALMEGVPELLTWCTCCNSGDTQNGVNISAIRTLRLVDKEASRVALLALRKYTFVIKGDVTDTDLLATRLLRQAGLQNLELQVAISGSYSPALQLDAFVRNMGAALRFVSNLTIRFDMTHSSSIIEAAISEEIIQMISACTALKSLNYLGNLSAELLSEFGQLCPDLSSITLSSSDKTSSHMQTMVNLLPGLFPKVTTLAFKTPFAIDGGNMPDLSGNTGITNLNLACCISSEAQWLLLPPKLKHLKIYCASAAPPQLCGTEQVLGSLLSMECRTFDGLNLSQLTDLLRGLSPSLYKSLFQNLGEPACIECKVDDSTAADLACMRDLAEFPWVRNGVYDFQFDPTAPEMSSKLIKAFPEMTGFTHCSLDCEADQLRLLLKVFPDIVGLHMTSSELDDIDLQDVHVCSRLEVLDLFGIKNITPSGLVALCLHLPALNKVQCDHCDQFTEVGLDTIEQVLLRYGKIVDVQGFCIFD